MANVTLHHLICAFTKQGLQTVSASKQIPAHILKLAELYCMPSGQACLLPGEINPAYGCVFFGDAEQHFMLFCIKPSKRGRHARGALLFGHGRIGNKHILEQLDGDPLALLHHESLFIDNDEAYLDGVQPDTAQLDYQAELSNNPVDDFKRLLNDSFDQTTAVQLLAALLMKQRIAVISESLAETQTVLIVYRLLPKNLQIELGGISSNLLMQGHHNLALVSSLNTQLTEVFQATKHSRVITLQLLPSMTPEHLTNLAENLITWSLQNNDTALRVINTTTLQEMRNPKLITQRLELIKWLEKLLKANTAKALLPLLEHALQASEVLYKTACQGQCQQFFKDNPRLSQQQLHEELDVMLFYIRLCENLAEPLSDCWLDISARFGQLWQPQHTETALIVVHALISFAPVLKPEIRQQLSNWQEQHAAWFPELSEQNPVLLNTACNVLTHCHGTEITRPYSQGLAHWFIAHADSSAKKQLVQAALKLSVTLTPAEEKQSWILDCINPFQTEPDFKGVCMEAVEHVFSAQAEIQPPLNQENRTCLQQAIHLWIKMGAGSRVGIRKWKQELGKAGLSKAAFELIWTACDELDDKTWRNKAASQLTQLLEEIPDSILSAETAKVFYEFCSTQRINCPITALYPYLIQGLSAQAQQDLTERYIRQNNNQASLLAVIIKSADFKVSGWLLSQLSRSDCAEPIAHAIKHYLEEYTATTLGFETIEDYDKLLTDCYQYLNIEERRFLFVKLIEELSLQKVISEIKIVLYQADIITDSFYNTYLLPVAKRSQTDFVTVLSKLIRHQQNQEKLIHWVIVTANNKGLQLWAGWARENDTLIKPVVETIGNKVQANDVDVLLSLVEKSETDKSYKLQYIQKLITQHINDCAYANTVFALLDSVKRIGGDSEAEKLAWIISSKVDSSYLDHYSVDYKRWCRALKGYYNNHRLRQGVSKPEIERTLSGLGGTSEEQNLIKIYQNKNSVISGDNRQTNSQLTLSAPFDSNRGAETQPEANTVNTCQKSVVIKKGIAESIYQGDRNITPYLSSYSLTVYDPEFIDYLILMASEFDGPNWEDSKRQKYLRYAIENFYHYWLKDIHMHFQYAHSTIQGKKQWSENDLKLAIIRLVDIIKVWHDLNEAMRTLKMLYELSDVAIIKTILLATGCELVSPSVTTNSLQNKNKLDSSHKLTLITLTQHIDKVYQSQAKPHNLHALDLKYANRLLIKMGKEIIHGHYKCTLAALKASEKWITAHSPQDTVLADCLKIFAQEVTEKPQYPEQQELRKLRYYLETEQNNQWPSYLKKQAKVLLTQLPKPSI